MRTLGERSLPRHYWPIVVVYVIFACLIGVAFGLTWDVDPYICAAVMGGVAVLLEAWKTSRWKAGR